MWWKLGVQVREIKNFKCEKIGLNCYKAEEVKKKKNTVNKNYKNIEKNFKNRYVVK